MALFKSLSGISSMWSQDMAIDLGTANTLVVLKEKESLIASIEVKPILKNLIQIFSIISVLALSGILIFQYNNF